MLTQASVPLFLSSSFEVRKSKLLGFYRDKTTSYGSNFYKYHLKTNFKQCSIKLVYMHTLKLITIIAGYRLHPNPPLHHPDPTHHVAVQVHRDGDDTSSRCWPGGQKGEGQVEISAKVSRRWELDTDMLIDYLERNDHYPGITTKETLVGRKKCWTFY